MANEYFSNSLNHPTLQRHLLAVPTVTFVDAVQAGEKFLQFKSRESTLGRAIRAVENVKANAGYYAVRSVKQDTLHVLLSTVEQLAEQVKQLQNKPTNRASRK